MLTTGIETKRQKDMNKGELQHFMHEEYKNWIDICEQKFPNAAVQGWLEFTTGTRSAKVNGAYLYRNFTEGLRVFHKCVPLWTQTLAEGSSGKAKEEIWKRFCYLLNCSRLLIEPEEATPKDFDWEKIEKQKWMYAFKWMGPPCEFLELGDKKCHEFLANPTEVSKRGTGTKERNKQQLSRKHSREKAAQRTRLAAAKASATKKQLTDLEIARTQTVHNQMKIEAKQAKQRFDMLQTLLQMSDDPEFKQQMMAET